MSLPWHPDKPFFPPKNFGGPSAALFPQVFGPIRAERNYTVMNSLDLSPSGWNELTGGSQSDDGEERTVTDPDASGPRKFYNVRIGR